MSERTGALTSLQVKDRQIRDLRSQLESEKNKRRNDAEEFGHKCRNCLMRKDENARVVEMLQRELAASHAREKANAEEKEDLIKRISALEDKAAVLEARCKKDSTNSSKPPSTDGLKKKPATVSTRVKSGNKPGGQIGHVGHPMKIDSDDDEMHVINEGECPHCGGEIAFGESYAERKIVDIKVTVLTKTERACKGKCVVCGTPFTAPFTDEFTAPQKYGPNISSLVAVLNEYGNIADAKTAEIVSAICGGRVNMSAGTVVNIRRLAADRLEAIAVKIKEALIKAKVLYVDETGIRVSGKLNWANVYTDGTNTLFEHNEKRGFACKCENGILDLFLGILMHDHFKSYYKKKHMTHAECNQHILRALKSVIDIQNREWAKNMSEFLLDAKAKKEARIADGMDCFSAEELDGLRAKYIEILDSGDKEFAEATSGITNKRRFSDERCLLKRLREYKDEHLRFLSDFRVEFGNNAAEQAVHSLKGKIRVSGGFRTDAGADRHMVIASVISTARKMGRNIYSVFETAFGNPAALALSP